MNNYFGELCKAMEWLGQQPDTIFIGQAVKCPGTMIYTTLKNVSEEKRIEFPVMEDTQMGVSIGIALDGTIIPISIFPRWNFLLLATNQIVNHLDKIPTMADVPYKPKIIIRTSIGSTIPLHPQHQHTGNYTDAFRLMCKHIEIIRLDEPEQIFESYQKAYQRTDGKSTILVEWGNNL